MNGSNICQIQSPLQAIGTSIWTKLLELQCGQNLKAWKQSLQHHYIKEVKNICHKKKKNMTTYNKWCIRKNILLFNATK